MGLLRPSLALIALHVSACARGSSGDAGAPQTSELETPATTPRPAAAEEPHPTPAPAAPPTCEPPLGELITGSMEGLFAVPIRGGRRRKLSAGPALHPRWLDRGHVLVLHPLRSQGYNGGALIERVDVCDGGRERLAKLPAFRCTNLSAGDNAAMDVEVQDAREVCLSADKRLACIGLMDRNWNMASRRLEVVAELDSGKVTRRLTLGEEECRPPRDTRLRAKDEELPCSCYEPDDDAPPSRAPALRFAFDAGRVIDDSQPGELTTRLVLRDYQPEGSSPSGRYLVLGGDEEEGDYLYRRLVLLDRQTGEVFPVGEEPAPWPKPVATASQRRRHVALPIAGAGLFIRETVPHWLRYEDAELLLLDELLVTPGGPSRRLDGEVAR